MENENKIQIVQPAVRYHETQELIKKIEEKIGMPLVVYWNSFNGAVCANDIHGFYNLFKQLGHHDKIALFVKSSGGHTESALRIVNIIRNYAGHVTAMIPLEAASSATLITLGSDVIKMGPLSYITPIDSSSRHQLAPVDPVNNSKVSVSNDEVLRLDKLWNEHAPEGSKHHYEELYKYIHPIVLGSLDRSSSLSIKICEEILSYHMDDREECSRISHLLNGDYPSHSYPIMLKEAKEMGLQVDSLDHDVNDLLLELNDWYSEMGSRAYTDFDEYNYHDNQILNILESRNQQLYYQNDKNWTYMKEERRWVVLNDNSDWYRTELDDEGDIVKKIIYIS